MDIDKHFLSRKEASQYFNVSLSTVDRGIKNQKAPFDRRILINKRQYFLLEYFIEYKNRVYAVGAIQP